MKQIDTKLSKMLEESLYVHKELKDDIKNGAYYRWSNKKVLKSKTIYKGDTLDNITCSACTTISLSNEFVKTGKTSLLIHNSTDVENVSPRPWPSVRINVKEFDLSEYNRVVIDAYIKAVDKNNEKLFTNYDKLDFDIVATVMSSFKTKKHMYKFITPYMCFFILYFFIF